MTNSELITTLTERIKQLNTEVFALQGGARNAAQQKNKSLAEELMLDALKLTTKSRTYGEVLDMIRE